MLKSAIVKEQVHQKLLQLIEEKIQIAKKNLEDTIQSRDNESKSSVGDKYETGRAMMQLEQQQNEQQLNQAFTLKQQLLQLKLKPTHTIIQQGSFIATNFGYFYLSIGLGEIQVKQQKIYVISLASPLGSNFSGKKIKDKVEFQGKVYEILDLQ